MFFFCYPSFGHVGEKERNCKAQGKRKGSRSDQQPIPTDISAAIAAAAAYGITNPHPPGNGGQQYVSASSSSSLYHMSITLTPPEKKSISIQRPSTCRTTFRFSRLASARAAANRELRLRNAHQPTTPLLRNACQPTQCGALSQKRHDVFPALYISRRRTGRNHLHLMQSPLFPLIVARVDKGHGRICIAHKLHLKPSPKKTLEH